MRTRSTNGARLLVVFSAALLLLVGCGDDPTTSTVPQSSTTAPADATTSTAPADTTTTTTTVPPATSTTAAETTTSTVPEETTSTTTTLPASTEPLPEADLPGTVFDLTPPPDTVLSVIGVAHDDVLNVRRAPGTDQPIVARLDNLADDLVASGRARALTRSLWWEVTTADGTVGWVNARFTARMGPTFDQTATIVDLIGSIPTAETMLDLGVIAANSVNFAAHNDPEVPLRVVLVVPPLVGDLGEVTYDVIGLGGDTTVAARLHVFGQPTDSGEGFSLTSVEATEMCDPVRGMSPPGEPCT